MPEVPSLLVADFVESSYRQAVDSAAPHSSSGQSWGLKAFRSWIQGLGADPSVVDVRKKVAGNV